MMIAIIIDIVSVLWAMRKLLVGLTVSVLASRLSGTVHIYV